MITVVTGSFDGMTGKLCDYPDGFNNKNTLIIGAWYYRNTDDAYEFRNNGFINLQLDGIYVSISTQVYNSDCYAIAMIKVK